MNYQGLQRWAFNNEACFEARVWIDELRPDAQTAWQKCRHGDWMFWALGKMLGTLELRISVMTAVLTQVTERVAGADEQDQEFLRNTAQLLQRAPPRDVPSSDEFYRLRRTIHDTVPVEASQFHLRNAYIDALRMGQQQCTGEAAFRDMTKALRYSGLNDPNEFLADLIREHVSWDVVSNFL